MDNSFKDAKGRDWTVVVDGYVLYRARTNGKVDLSSLVAGAMQGGEDGKGAKIDPSILLELCYYGCEHHSRIEAGKVTKEDFLRMLKGAVCMEALEATTQAVFECFGLDKKDEKPPPGPPEDAGNEKNGEKATGSASPSSPASTPGDTTNSET